MLSSAIYVFLSILIQNGLYKNHSRSNFRGGGGAPVAPPWIHHCIVYDSGGDFVERVGGGGRNRPSSIGHSSGERKLATVA